MLNDDNPTCSFFINVDFTLVDRSTLIDEIIDYKKCAGFKYVVTANADHMVRLPKDKKFQEAYDDADIATCDSRVVMLLAKIFGYDLGEVITGSDLTKDVLSELSNKDVPIIIIGSESSEIELLQKKCHLLNVHHYNPPMGFIRSENEIKKCVDFISHVGEGIILLCVGSPQQEILAKRIKETYTFTGIALCVGASIHFITGKVQRAPKWVQAIAMEWAYRMFKEPKRLIKRYVACLDIFRLALLFSMK